MRITKIFLVIFACSLLLSVPIFAAGKTESTEKKEVTLTYFQYKTEIIDQLDELAAIFHEQNPYITIEIETPADFTTVLKSRIASDNMPDIYNVKEAGWKLERYVKPGFIVDLTDQPFIQRVADMAKPAVTYNGKIYALPMDVAAQGVIYNKDIFQRAGIETPPRTPTELEEAVKKIKAIGIIPFGIAAKSSWSLRQMFAQGQGATVDPIKHTQQMSEGKATFWNEKMDRVFDVFDLIFNNSNARPFESDYTNQTTLFAQEKVAMIVQGLWAMNPVLKVNPDINVGMFGFPALEDPEMSRMMVDDDYKLAISAKSPHIEEALKFFDFLTSKTATDIWIAEAKLISSVKGTDVEKMGSSAALDIKRYIDTGKTYPWGYAYWPTGLTGELEKLIQNYYLGKLTRKELTTTMDDLWKEMISK